MRGFTMWLCFGSWGGFRFEFGGSFCFLRICAGWVSFVASSIDVENVIDRNLKEIAALRAMVQNGHIAQQTNGADGPSAHA